MSKVEVSFEITEEQHARLLEIAAELGCIALRGPRSGAPSIHALLADLAAGDLTARRRRGRQLRSASASDRVRTILAERPDTTSAEVAREAKCSISLVSKIRQGVNPAPGSR